MTVTKRQGHRVYGHCTTCLTIYINWSTSCALSCGWGLIGRGASGQCQGMVSYWGGADLAKLEPSYLLGGAQGLADTARDILGWTRDLVVLDNTRM